MTETARNRQKLTPKGANGTSKRAIKAVRSTLFTISEFCEATRISTRQFYRLAAAGVGPRQTRLGGNVFIRVDESHRWLQERTEV